MKAPASSYNIKLASKSPRRQQLLQSLEIDFEIWSMEVDETFPPELQREEIPLHLAKIKADAFLPRMQNNDLVITADTIVWIDDRVLNKPADAEEALTMLRMLNGKTHEVYTAVCLRTLDREEILWDCTQVHFAQLAEEELLHYIAHYKPFDKAGSYGAQDWIGLVGIDRLEGSYFNVMGLPVHKLYSALKTFQ
jgi:septum formation protein